MSLLISGDSNRYAPPTARPSQNSCMNTSLYCVIDPAAYERLTGQTFQPGEEPAGERIRRNVAAYLEAQ